MLNDIFSIRNLCRFRASRKALANVWDSFYLLITGWEDKLVDVMTKPIIISQHENIL
jgi:hypothetical protein